MDDELIKYPYNGSLRLSRMSRTDRAAQFSPFAALTGFGGVLAEAARETEQRLDVTEERQDKINEGLMKIIENFPERTTARIVYFVPDRKKSGGSYETAFGKVRHIDESSMNVMFSDNKTIPISDIYDIELLP